MFDKNLQIEFNDECARHTVREVLKNWLEAIRTTEPLQSKVQYILPEESEESKQRALQDLRAMISPPPTEEEWVKIRDHALAGLLWVDILPELSTPIIEDQALTVTFKLDFSKLD